jgi:hypothetical protein
MHQIGATLLLTAFFACISAHAAAPFTLYEIDLEAQIGSAPVLKEKVKVKEGELRSIFFKGGAVTLLPSQAEDGTLKLQAQILRKTELGYLLIEKPVWNTSLNSPVEATQSSEEGGTFFHVKLTPKKL